MTYQVRTKESSIKKGDVFKLSVKGHNDFFYPSKSVFHAHKDMKYTRVGWLSFEGLRPVKILTTDLSETVKAMIAGKYSVVWITI